MTIDARLDTLGRKHSELEAKLKGEMRRPAADELRVHDLKRRKLQIKDEMASLTTELGSAS